MTNFSRLLTVAYPELSEIDKTWIQAFRRAHDPRADAVNIHFSLVFGQTSVPQNQYVGHIQEVCKTQQKIPFCCNYAMLAKDDEQDFAYVFLVPDEGNGAISRLHDKLYTGTLRALLRLDIPYIPHITIGSGMSFERAKSLCDELNAKQFCVKGLISNLTIICSDKTNTGSVVKNLVSYGLK